MYTSREVYEYISKQTGDPIVERKVCAVSGTQFPIFQSDLDFYATISPSFAGTKFPIPTPTLCPEERSRRRMFFRNERKLYKRKCDATAENIISMYSPEKSFKVYHQKIWRSDKRDPMDYGRDFDFSKTFTEQFGELMKDVPRANFYGMSNENCDYTNHCNFCKDCYLCADLVRAENCLYSNTSIDSNYSIDCMLATNSQVVYNVIESDGIFNAQYIYFCSTCSHSMFLLNCTHCEFCFACTNLDGKKYCIANEQYSQQGYEQKLKSLMNSDYVDMYVSKIFAEGTRKNVSQTNSENCFGDGISNSKNTWGFSIFDSVDVKYSSTCGRFENAYDCYETGLSCSKIYECHAVMESNNSSFITISYTNNNSYYLDNCHNNNNCFGCIGLRNKSYCIFNKQYTPEEYEIMVGKIIRKMIETGERGEFFYPSLSPFGYNETVAQEYYPLSQEQAIARGYKWQETNYDPTIPTDAKVIDRRQEGAGAIAESSNEDILKSIFICEVSGRPYRIIKQELDFYYKHNLSLPRRHPDIRHEARTKLRPGRILYLRNCDCCRNEMLSVHPSPEQKEKVYCEPCYQKEIYG